MVLHAGFFTLERIVGELQQVGAESDWCSTSLRQLKDSKRYLKTSYRLHGSESESICPDHCPTFALSDEENGSFKNTCTHAHDSICQECETLKDVIAGIHEKISCASTVFYSKEQKEDLMFDCERAKLDVLEWKSHIFRSVNQEKAKQDALHNLKDGESLIVMDWAMKFTEVKFREKYI